MSKAASGARAKAAAARARRHAELLGAIGGRVRAARQGRSWTRAELAKRSGVSLRFLAQLEAGEGNISIARLDDVARALGTRCAALVEGEPAEATARAHVALLGVRGAGKSTVGPKLAARLGLPFHELDALIERAADLPLAQIFEVHGEAYYRRLEREVLATHLQGAAASVIATGGSLVTDGETYRMLRARAVTVWLKARPEDHLRRVLAQGDRRPMEKRPHAMQELKALLVARAPLYAQADHAVDTAHLDADEVAERVLRSLAA